VAASPGSVLSSGSIVLALVASVELPEVATEFSTLPLLMSILLGLKLLEGAVLLTARSPET